jgi:hypothetical protein
MARAILRDECSLEVNRSRFKFGPLLYPLNIVCFEDNTRWGYFDSKFFQIGLNVKLIGRVSDHALRNLLRHELAHYLTHLYFPKLSSPHGEEFLSLCQRYGWGEDVSRAKDDLAALPLEGATQNQAMLSKVKKLLALASSSNQHEAELATLKANQLILRYHLEKNELNDEPELLVHTVMTAPKKNTLMVAIYDILTHFLVRPMLYFGQGEVRLEVAGPREQLELADYIAKFLEHEFERLWNLETNLKGLRAKNSFYLGIARGFSEKLQASRKDFTVTESRALVKLESDLSEKLQHFLGGLSKTSSGQQLDDRALQSGVARGRSLSIHPGVKGKITSFLGQG